MIDVESGQAAEHRGQLPQEGLEALPFGEGQLRPTPLQSAREDLGEKLEARLQLVRPRPLLANRIEGKHAHKGLAGAQGERQV